MSLEAKGLLCFILSLPDDWTLYKSWAMEKLSVGRRVLDRCLIEIEKSGYLAKFEIVRSNDGRYSGNGYVFYDENICTKRTNASVQNVQPSSVHSPCTANVHLLSTNKIPSTNNTTNTNSHAEQSSASFEAIDDSFKQKEQPKEKTGAKKERSVIYGRCVDEYFRWHEKLLNIKPQFDGSDGASMHQAIKYLRSMEDGDDNIFKNFSAVLSGFDRWDKFHQGQTRMRQINSNLTNIINQLKNGKSNSKATLAGIAAEMAKRNYE